MTYTEKEIRRIEEIKQWPKNRKIEWNQPIERPTEDRIVTVARDRWPNGRPAIECRRKT